MKHLLLLVALAVLGLAGLLTYQSLNKPLMTVTSSGGNCGNRMCNHPKYNLYNDGTFEGHSRLANSEVAELKS